MENKDVAMPEGLSEPFGNQASMRGQEPSMRGTNNDNAESLMSEPIHEFPVPFVTATWEGGQAEMEPPQGSASKQANSWDDGVTSHLAAAPQQKKCLFKVKNERNKACAFAEDLKKFYRLYISIDIAFTGLWEEEDTDSSDHFLFLADRLLAAQNRVRSQGRNTHVDIGYHYTDASNLPSIRREGLLTKAERDDRGIKAKYNGSANGDGVYTGNNPLDYSRFGNLGLFVARLSGFVSAIACDGQQQWEDQHDSKSLRGMVVLKTSSQCVPLVACNASLMGARNKKTIFEVHLRLQEIIDKHFNDGKRTAVSMAPPSKASRKTQNCRLFRKRQSNNQTAPPKAAPIMPHATLPLANKVEPQSHGTTTMVTAPPCPGQGAVLVANLNQKVGANINGKVCCKPRAEDSGLREISLQSVLKELRNRGGEIPLKRLIKIFRVRKSSPVCMVKAFREAVKELCVLREDPSSGKVLVLKQHHVIANAPPVPVDQSQSTAE